MGKHQPASIEHKRFICPHCGTFAAHDWYSSLGQECNLPSFVSDYAAKIAGLGADFVPEDPSGNEFLDRYAGRLFAGSGEVSGTFTPLINLFVSDCHGCGQLSVWAHRRLVYPAHLVGDEPNEDLSEDIKRDYREAQAIVETSPRGAAALLRLALQKLCVQLGEKGKNINDDVKSLVRKGLDARVQKALDIVRVIGNEAVHPGTMDLRDDRKTAVDLFGLVNLIALQMISQPKRLQEMYNQLPQDKRDGIAARDKADGRA